MSDKIEERIEAQGSVRVFVMLSAALVDFMASAGVFGDAVAKILATFLDGETYAPPRILGRLGVISGTINKAGYDALRKNPVVNALGIMPQFRLIMPERISPVASAAVQAIVNPSITQLKAQELWPEHQADGVIIGHLDSGVTTTHGAFSGGAIPHFTPMDHYDGCPDTLGGTDPCGHGTHTAGILAARRHIGRNVGVAPLARLASAVVGDCHGEFRSAERVMGGIEWALCKGARVLNLSVEVVDEDDTFRTFVRALLDRDILPVCAVGNKGENRSCIPGNYAEVLSVGACDHLGRVLTNSSSQYFAEESRSVPHVIAPGNEILSAHHQGGFSDASGTSMATPHIAGVAAILRGACPRANAKQVRQAILESCPPLPAGVNAVRAGKGVPDAVRALERLRELSD
jgi:subtilisin